MKIHKKIILSITLTFSLLGANEAVAYSKSISASWKKYLSSLPKDARDVFTKRIKCNSFGGDQLSKEENKVFNKLGCPANEQEIGKIKEKYSTNIQIKQAIDCIDSTANAINCPE